MKKQIPNIFTLINLIFGCIAILFILQTGETIVVLDSYGASNLNLPERMTVGSLFIFGAAIVDFLDGFLARLLGANSERGKQLDSLCDVVSFGVAPSMILYQLLRMAFAREQDGLDTTVLALFPAFIFAAAVAWRLAKFNISTNQTYSFRRVPSPAGGLLVASFPLILWYTDQAWVQSFLLNEWALYAIILIVSFLMVSNVPFMAMKFKDYSFKNNQLKYSLLILSIAAIATLHWLAVPVIFVLYLVVSFLSKEPPPMVADVDRETLDVTV